MRQISPGGALRVLMTNLDASAAPAAAFGALYHQRWPHRRGLQAPQMPPAPRSRLGPERLSQHALLIDVAAKVLADNHRCAAVAWLQRPTRHPRNPLSAAAPTLTPSCCACFWLWAM